MRLPFSRRQLVLLAALAGVPAGLGATTFHYAGGLSYLSTEPRACANCHIMRPQYDSWQKSSHHTTAACVDCHLPADFVGKYEAKLRNGWNHSKAFTLQDFPEPIRITPVNAAILYDNCLRCHGDLTHGTAEPDCVHCHASAGHGEQVGLGGPWRGAANEEGIP